MNVETLRQKLLAAARANPPADRVPYTFEKRILARLAEHPAPDLTALWARALWRAAAACVACMLLLGAWTLLSAQNRSATASSATASLTESDDFSQHFERTMLAAVEEPTEETW